MQDFLWRRTPVEMLREQIAIRHSAAVVRELKECLDGNRGVVFLPLQTWYCTHFQRPQQMARAMAAEGHPIVYCEPWRTSHMVEANAKLERDFIGVKKIGDNLHLLRWPTNDLKSLLAQVDRGALLMLWPWQADFIPEGSNSRVIYEVIDDHSLATDADEKWHRQHKEWVNKSDVLVASADNLLSQLTPHRSDAQLLPNGVVLEDWKLSPDTDLPADLKISRNAEQVIAYYGAIAEWFDWPLWIHAAKARPNWSFVLIGQSYDNDPATVHAQAAAAPNIHYLGPKPYKELANYMRYVDVATIPFLLNPITHACSPVKMFEYMAAGKPIVATAMHEVLKYTSVLVAHSPDEFVRCLDQAVAQRDDAKFLESLRREAELNTWQSRAKALIAALHNSEAMYGDRTRRAFPSLTPTAAG